MKVLSHLAFMLLMFTAPFISIANADTFPLGSWKLNNVVFADGGNATGWIEGPFGMWNVTMNDSLIHFSDSPGSGSDVWNGQVSSGPYAPNMGYYIGPGFVDIWVWTDMIYDPFHSPAGYLMNAAYDLFLYFDRSALNGSAPIPLDLSQSYFLAWYDIADGNGGDTTSTYRIALVSGELTTTVPEPSSLLLTIGGLLGFSGFSLLKRKI